MSTLAARSKSCIALIFSVALLASCGSGDENAGDVGATGGSQDGSPQRGGALVQATNADPSTLLPPLSTGVNDIVVSCKVFDALLSLDGDFRPVPSLAESWDISDDGTMYTFHLRQGVTWHDGEPFSSADVKFTFEEITAPFAPSDGPAFQQYVESIETPDENTVVIKLNEPYGPFLNLLACPDGAIAAKHIFEGTDIMESDAVNNPVGTGPFVFSDWERGQSLTLERNESYWEEGYPLLDQLIFRVIPDTATRVLSFEAGEVDFIQANFLPATDWQRLSAADGVQAEAGVSEPGNMVLIFNTTRPPFDDVRLRQAIFHAIDREAINQVALGGLGELAKSSISPGIGWANNPEVDLAEMYPYDPARAEELLDEAGGGEQLSITLPYDSADGALSAAAEIIQENLRQIGVDVQLQGSSRDVSLPQVFSNRDFDITLWSYTTRGDPTLGIERLYTSRYDDKQNFTNASGYSNPRVDELFEAAASTPDFDERAEALFEVQEILADEIPTIPLLDDFAGDVAQENVHGLWDGGATDNSSFARVWISE